MIVYGYIKQKNDCLSATYATKKWLFFDILSNRMIVYGYIKQKNDCLSTP